MTVYLLLGISFVVAAMASYALTPAVLRLAVRLNALDLPGGRKIHGRPIPRLGGISVFLSFFIAVGLVCLLAAPTDCWLFSTSGLLLVGGACLVLFIGIWDDIKLVRPEMKLLYQIAAASLVYAAGVRISIISHPFSTVPLDVSGVSFPLTLIWIVGITNAINLIDGLDGLASGTASIVAVMIGLVSLDLGDTWSTLLGFALAGSLLGFLRYNFHPAKIFLGDSGSLFIGFALAVLSITGSVKGSTTFAIAVPVLALGLPILDTFLSIFRRSVRTLVYQEETTTTLRGMLSAIVQPDRDHIHHRLLSHGLPYRRVVLLLYSVSVVLGCGALAISFAGRTLSYIVLASALVGGIAGVKQLNYREVGLLASNLRLKLLRLGILESRAAQVMLDISLVATAFLLGRVLGGGTLEGSRVIILLLIACPLQAGVFVLSGVYRITLRNAGVADALLITRAVAVGHLLVLLIVSLLHGSVAQTLVVSTLLSFFLTLSFLISSRFIMRYVAHRAAQDGTGKQRVLIYGAGAQGAAALNFVVHAQSLNVLPVGFLDDNPQFEGKTLNGYPIFGGHWKAERVIRARHVDEVLIADTSLGQEVLRRLRSVSRNTNVRLRYVNVGLESIRPDPVNVGEQSDLQARQATPQPARDVHAVADRGTIPLMPRR